MQGLCIQNKNTTQMLGDQVKDLPKPYILVIEYSLCWLLQCLIKDNKTLLEGFNQVAKLTVMLVSTDLGVIQKYKP